MEYQYNVHSEAVKAYESSQKGEYYFHDGNFTKAVAENRAAAENFHNTINHTSDPDAVEALKYLSEYHRTRSEDLEKLSRIVALNQLQQASLKQQKQKQQQQQRQQSNDGSVGGASRDKMDNLKAKFDAEERSQFGGWFGKINIHDDYAVYGGTTSKNLQPKQNSSPSTTSDQHHAHHRSRQYSEPAVLPSSSAVASLASSEEATPTAMEDRHNNKHQRALSEGSDAANNNHHHHHHNNNNNGNGNDISGGGGDGSNVIEVLQQEFNELFISPWEDYWASVENAFRRSTTPTPTTTTTSSSSSSSSSSEDKDKLFLQMQTMYQKTLHKTQHNLELLLEFGNNAPGSKLLSSSAGDDGASGGVSQRLLHMSHSLNAVQLTRLQNRIAELEKALDREQKLRAKQAQTLQKYQTRWEELKSHAKQKKQQQQQQQQQQGGGGGGDNNSSGSVSSMSSISTTTTTTSS